jgi:hypothetical protein
MKKRKVNWPLKSKILITNYFSTKFYAYNVIKAMSIYKNKKILIQRKSRLTYFYSTLGFVIKHKTWKIIYKLLYNYIASHYKKKFPMHTNFFKFLTLKTAHQKQNNTIFRQAEYLCNL